MREILIATTNQGKFEEITNELADLKLKFVNLSDLKLSKVDVDEPFHTTIENAIYKAKFFAKKTGLVTIAEDTGLFIKYLNGEPGVNTKRAAASPEERVKRILKLMTGVPDKKRKAYFETAACIYDPKGDSFHVFKGTLKGEIAKKMGVPGKIGTEHDAIFYFPKTKKLLSEMTTEEKNLISHRGQVVQQIKIFIQRMYNLIC